MIPLSSNLACNANAYGYSSEMRIAEFMSKITYLTYVYILYLIKILRELTGNPVGRNEAVEMRLRHKCC